MKNSNIVERLKEIQFWNNEAIEFHDRTALSFIEKLLDELIKELENE